MGPLKILKYSNEETPMGKNFLNRSLWFGVLVNLLLTISIPQALAVPRAVVPKPIYTMDSVVEGQKIVHDFVIQNAGSAPLKILDVRTD
jgi:hypothetical protein